MPRWRVHCATFVCSAWKWPKHKKLRTQSTYLLTLWPSMPSWRSTRGTKQQQQQHAPSQDAHGKMCSSCSGTSTLCRFGALTPLGTTIELCMEHLFLHISCAWSSVDSANMFKITFNVISTMAPQNAERVMCDPEYPSSCPDTLVCVQCTASDDHCQQSPAQCSAHTKTSKPLGSCWAN